MVNVSDVRPILNVWSEGLYPRKADWLEKQEAWELFAADYGIDR
jgi:hypothetical protein